MPRPSIKAHFPDAWGQRPKPVYVGDRSRAARTVSSTKTLVFPTFLPIREDFYNATNGRFGADADQLLYNGPFRISQWVHGSSMTSTESPLLGPRRISFRYHSCALHHVGCHCFPEFFQRRQNRLHGATGGKPHRSHAYGLADSSASRRHRLLSGI